MANCPQCGAAADPSATQCRYCGEPLQVMQPVIQPTMQQQQYAPPVYQQPVSYAVQDDGIDPSWPLKSKVAAGVLAIFLGGLGIHKFYLGKIGLGILYLIFCWTYIPSFIGFIEGIIYLASSDRNFQVKHRVRIM